MHTDAVIGKDIQSLDAWRIIYGSDAEEVSLEERRSRLEALGVYGVDYLLQKCTCSRIGESG